MAVAKPSSPPAGPLTNVCIAANKSACPPDHVILTKTHEGTDADIWKDSFFNSRVTRYICISRAAPAEQHLHFVVIGIIIANAAVDLPPGFVAIERTSDSGAQATRKRVVGVRRAPRGSVTDAVLDLALTGEKKPPVGFLGLGNLNGLLLCVKVGEITGKGEESEAGRSG